jgi:hypothetical protein
MGTPGRALWPFLISTVDTVEARWSIQRRAPAGAEILDAAVLNLVYSLVRVADGGWCLECKHPYDPDLRLKQRAARWGQSLDTVRAWTINDLPVTREMIERLAETQNREVDYYTNLEGVPFAEVPRLTECGETSLRTDVHRSCHSPPRLRAFCWPRRLRSASGLQGSSCETGWPTTSAADLAAPG